MEFKIFMRPIILFSLISTSFLAHASKELSPIVVEEAGLEDPDSEMAGITRSFNDDMEGFTPLLKAIWEDDAQKVRQLVQEGADVNAEAPSGWTPIQIATIKENRPIIEFLLERGADVNKPDLHGTTPLGWAAANDNPDLAGVLLYYGATPTEGILGKASPRVKERIDQQ